jgi:Ankyrin repeats (3 copies)
MKDFSSFMPLLLSTLPYEIIRLFTSKLSLKDALNLHQTCTSLYSLLDYNHDPRLDNQFAIKMACRKDRVDIFKKLLTLKYIVMEQDVYDAAANGQVSLVQVFIESGLINSKKLKQVFLWAMNSEQIVVVELLMSSDAIESFDSAISLSARQGKFKVLKTLLGDCRANPAACDNIAICEAAGRGDVEMVKYLLKDNRVDPGAQEDTPITHAAYRGYVEVVRLLLNDDRVDPKGTIYCAASSGQASVVELMLQDPREKPDDILFHFAAARGRLNVIEVLLQDGRPDPSSFNNSALKIAQNNGYTEMIELLMNDPRVRAEITIQASKAELE